MLNIPLDLEPGEVAYLEIGNRRYAIACAGGDDEEERRQLPGGRQELAYRSSEEIADHLAPSLHIECLGDHAWGVYDGRVLVGWSANRSGCDRVLDNYLGSRSEIMREGRRGKIRERLTYR